MGAPLDPPGQQLWWIHPSPRGGAGIVSPHRHMAWQYGCRQGKCRACHLVHPGHASPGPPAAPLGRYCSSTALYIFREEPAVRCSHFWQGLNNKIRGMVLHQPRQGNKNRFTCRNGRCGTGLLASTVDRGLPSFQLFARFVRVWRTSFLEKPQIHLVLSSSWVRCLLNAHEKLWSHLSESVSVVTTSLNSGASGNWKDVALAEHLGASAWLSSTLEAEGASSLTISHSEDRSTSSRE